MTREIHRFTYDWLAEAGMSTRTVASIEHGGNYRMSSLFKLAFLLGCVIMVNSEEVYTYKELGPKLKVWRERFRYNRVELSKKSEIPMTTLNEMERGGDFSKKNLLKYGSCVVINLDLKTPEDIQRETDIALKSGKYIILGSKLNSLHGQ